MSLHPNWVALSTVPIRIKQFVSESKHQNWGEENLRDKFPQGNITTGAEAKRIYTDIINDPDLNKTKKPARKIITEKKRTNEITAKHPVVFNINTFMRCATVNDYEQMENILEHNLDKVNSTDQFGWTALMCAACSKSTEVVKMLLEYGADYKVMDKKGNTAFSLAKGKGHKDVLLCIAQYRQNERKEHVVKETQSVNEKSEETEMFYCELCKLPFKECTVEGHRSSTLHLFNDKHFNFGTVYGIPQCNKGYQLMLKTGWDKESGLGPSGSGQKFPVKTVIRSGRTGLGVQQNPPRVTHFTARDQRAVQKNSANKIQNKKDILRNDLREKRKDRFLRVELS